MSEMYIGFDFTIDSIPFHKDDTYSNPYIQFQEIQNTFLFVVIEFLTKSNHRELILTLSSSHLSKAILETPSEIFS